MTPIDGVPAFLIRTGSPSGAAAIRQLAASGLFPAEVVVRRQSLEAVFIELTGDHDAAIAVSADPAAGPATPTTGTAATGPG